MPIPLAEEATEYVWLSDAGVDQYYYRVRQLLQMDGPGQGFDMLMACRHGSLLWPVVRLFQDSDVVEFVRVCI